MIRTFCFHDWEKWSNPSTHVPGGSWVTDKNEKIEWLSIRDMAQRRECRKCGAVSFRKCR